MIIHKNGATRDIRRMKTQARKKYSVETNNDNNPNQMMNNNNTNNRNNDDDDANNNKPPIFISVGVAEKFIRPKKKKKNVYGAAGTANKVYGCCHGCRWYSISRFCFSCSCY